MLAFLVSLWMVFIAELGDKTQLVALCFATRFRARTVLAGVFAATLIVHIFSVALGAVINKILPPGWVELTAGLAFIGFGLWTLRGDNLDEDSCKNAQGRYPFLIVATTFFLAELGDKTMLTTIAVTTRYPGYLVLVWLGSSLGMVVSDGLAILVGKLLGAKLPERLVKAGAAIIFFGFGLSSVSAGVNVVQKSVTLPVFVWMSLTVLAGVVVILRMMPKRQSLIIKETLPVLMVEEPDVMLQRDVGNR